MSFKVNMKWWKSKFNLKAVATEPPVGL